MVIDKTKWEKFFYFHFHFEASDGYFDISEKKEEIVLF